MKRNEYPKELKLIKKKLDKHSHNGLSSKCLRLGTDTRFVPGQIVPLFVLEQNQVS